MKLLAFSDLHADVAAARRLVQLAAHVDVLIGAGDFGNARRDIDVCLRILAAVRRPAILVPGNSESDDELQMAARIWPEARVLHGSSASVAGQVFFGLGGGVPVTPFGAWSFDLTEDEAAEKLAAMPNGAVLVCHSPPKGLLDRDSRGRSLGSTAILSAIERQRPPLVVCGHIHASAGQSQMHGPTQIVNAGPAGVMLELDA